jgi:MoaA/NifB/PqqE/SkfB family radical SAM enzyme
MQNIELLHRHAVQFRVNTVVMKPNFHEVGRVTGLAKSMGASGIALLQYLPVGQAADKLDYAISTVDFLQLGRKLKEEHEDETFRVFLKDTKSVEGYLVVQADGRAYVNRSTETGESRIRQVLIGDLVTDQLSEVWCRAFQAPTTLSL